MSLFVAPADPARIPAIATMLSGKLLRNAIVNSAADMPQGDIDVAIVAGDAVRDALLRKAGIVFLGNSITGGGGMAPYDAASAGNAIVFGRNMQSHQDVARRLVEQRGARMVDDAKALAVAVRDLLANPPLAQDMAANAMTTILQLRGALALTRNVLQPYVARCWSRRACTAEPRCSVPERAKRRPQPHEIR
ncbi:MAG: hypothetical protein HC779_04600 [Phyllobacteriaceae bacterium]|nr:hypothetical protein [Phyllobacteriaceae bacterium]